MEIFEQLSPVLSGAPRSKGIMAIIHFLTKGGATADVEERVLLSLFFLLINKIAVNKHWTVSFR